MDGRLSRALSTIALGIVLAWCAAAALAANYAFAPPEGWARVRSGTDSTWLDPSGTERVQFFLTNYPGDLDSLVKRTLKQEHAANPTMHVWTNRNYLICGNHVARYVIWTSTSHGTEMVWERLIALWGDDGYLLTYARPRSHPPSTIARRSLVSICGVGEPSEQPGGVPIPPHIAPAQGEPPAVVVPADIPSPDPGATISHPYVPVIPGG